MDLKIIHFYTPVIILFLCTKRTIQFDIQRTSQFLRGVSSVAFLMLVFFVPTLRFLRFYLRGHPVSVPLFATVIKRKVLRKSQSSLYTYLYRRLYIGEVYKPYMDLGLFFPPLPLCTHPKRTQMIHIRQDINSNEARKSQRGSVSGYAHYAKPPQKNNLLRYRYSNTQPATRYYRPEVNKFIHPFVYLVCISSPFVFDPECEEEIFNEKYIMSLAREISLYV